MGYLAVNNKFPGVTLDMIKWWFAWHPLESLRYKIWDPYCHPYAAIADVDREKIQNPNMAIEDKISDVVHFVCEDIGGGVQDIVIHFRPVEEIGFTKEELDKAHAGCRRIWPGRESCRTERKNPGNHDPLLS